MVELGSVLEIGYLDIVVILGLLYVIYRMFIKRHDDVRNVEPPLPPMPRRDFTVKELLEYNGVKNQRLLLAVFDKVYDVTRSKSFYGPGGSYENFVGHDATRALGTFDVMAVRDEEDDLSDMDPAAVEEARKWDSEFKCKYPYVGRLLGKGDKPMDYKGELATL